MKTDRGWQDTREPAAGTRDEVIGLVSAAGKNNLTQGQVARLEELCLADASLLRLYIQQSLEIWGREYSGVTIGSNGFE